jgi:hypothetical protein
VVDAVRATGSSTIQPVIVAFGDQFHLLNLADNSAACVRLDVRRRLLLTKPGHALDGLTVRIRRPAINRTFTQLSYLRRGSERICNDPGQIKTMAINTAPNGSHVCVPVTSDPTARVPRVKFTDVSTPVE